jgi:hypothetical protein
LNYCRTKVRFGVVEAINGNIKALLRRGRGYKNLAYLLLKAQRLAITKTEIHRSSEGSLKCASLQILVPSPLGLAEQAERGFLYSDQLLVVRWRRFPQETL